jgi:hypothetical protein
MRHIETVRNYLDTCCSILGDRGQQHDQTKLESPEVEIFEVYTPKLRECTYGSDQYKQNMKEMKVAIDHHNLYNRHHPEHHKLGIQGMTLFDLMEMLVDWKAAGMRHNDGDIYKSLEINQERFGYSDEVKGMLMRTMDEIQAYKKVFHKANES